VAGRSRYCKRAFEVRVKSLTNPGRTFESTGKRRALVRFSHNARRARRERIWDFQTILAAHILEVAVAVPEMQIP
jgi:hypothetical protein